MPQHSNFNLLTGRSEDHLQIVKDGTGKDFLLHFDIVPYFEKLKIKCESAGFKLALTSSFRSFSRQLAIWEKKANGQATLYDNSGENILSFKDLSPTEIVFAILRWSALPGCSRHHWGTDFDVYDASRLPSPEYQVELLISEVYQKGFCAPMHDFLDGLISSDQSYGFYRPYEVDLGGVSDERWHLSYRPWGKILQKKFTYDLFLKHLNSFDFTHKKIVQKHSDEIYWRFIQNTF
jgi:LAS superfamily LD-carboxypeptidase LdcB